MKGDGNHNGNPNPNPNPNPEAIAGEGKRVTVVDRGFIIDLVRAEFGDAFDYVVDDGCLDKPREALGWI